MKGVSKELIASVFGSRCHVRINPNRFLGYRKIVDSHEYSIYERPLKADKVVAAYGDVIVKKRGLNKLIYIPDARIPQINYHIKLTNRVFPGLYDNSKISQCLLLPYLRTIKQDTYVKDVRLCVFTDKGQIFHNKPARKPDCEGESFPNDVICFEESVVWDIPGRKFPSNNQCPAEHECYYPGLPKHCYSFSPLDNENPYFQDKYGNGGFRKVKRVFVDGKELLCSRFYKHARTEQSNPFLFIGTGTRSDKITLIGTYRSNVTSGVRVCIFASSDGGREWFCKYEFSDVGEYAFQQGYSNAWGTNFGNKISLGIDLDCEAFSIDVCKRNIVLPVTDDGNKNTKFAWHRKSEVVKIYGVEETIVQTSTPHNLNTGNIIALQSKSKLPKQVQWMCCETLNESNFEAGVQFKVRVIDEYNFEVFELVSSSIPTLPCRHIHHINTLKDGWIIGTGEIYPNGWLLYMEQRKADTYSIVNAGDSFVISRMNTKHSSVQRTMGMIVKDVLNCEVIYASDHDTLERDAINSTSLKNISRGSTGIYVGELKDIDDRNKFKCVYDAMEPCYLFQQIGDLMIFSGQRGELAISTDSNFLKWYKENLGRTIMYYFGNFHSYQIFNDYVILRK